MSSKLVWVQCGRLSASGRESSWLCLEIPGSDNVLRAFYFPYEVQPHVRVMLLGEPGFANQLDMSS